MVAKRNLADAPRYCVKSHQNELGVVPIGLTLEAGVITDVGTLPISIGVEMEGTATLIVKLPPDLGWDADALPYLLIGDNVDGGRILTVSPDLTTLSGDGYIRFAIEDLYTGRIVGYIGSTHVNPPGSGFRGALSADLGPYKSLTHATERNLYPVRSPVEDLTIMPLSLTATVGGEVDPVTVAAPLNVLIEKMVDPGQYLVTFPYSIPRRDKWIVAGTTSLGSTVTIADTLETTEDYEIQLTVKAASVPTDLLDGEELRVMTLGPSSNAAEYAHTPGAEDTTVRRRNYGGMYPVSGLWRDPVFDPFNVVIGPTGDVGLGAGSWAPPGTAFTQRGQVVSGFYDYNVGKVAKPVPDLEHLNYFVTGDALMVNDVALFDLDTTTIRDDAKLTFLATPLPIPAPDGRMCGYAFLGTNKEP